MTADDLVEDVEWLLDARTWPPEIAQRVGYSIRGLARRLADAGRADLARIFYPFEGMRLPVKPRPKRVEPGGWLAKHRRNEAACGNDAGYRKHYRLGERPCDACREAHRIVTQRQRDARSRRMEQVAA